MILRWHPGKSELQRNKIKGRNCGNSQVLLSYIAKGFDSRVEPQIEEICGSESQTYPHRVGVNSFILV